jgi:tRNA nucleotidyltransferase (CCA-adding enzyme)
METLTNIIFETDAIPSDVKLIRRILADYEVYAVGGKIRDSIKTALGSGDRTITRVENGDWDFASSAVPDEVEKLFAAKGYTVVPIGRDHGTMAVVINSVNYEITTFRHDFDQDGRHARVEYATTLEEDLRRRDFTINALALDLETGRVIDLFNGIADLQANLVRAIGDPDIRFAEDHLRLLRGIRFACKMQGRIEEKTWESIRKNASLIEKVSPERVREELMKMMGYEKPSHGILMMRESGLLAIILPELDNCFGVDQNRFHADDVGIHSVLAMDAVDRRYPFLRFLNLLHDIGKPQSKTWNPEKKDYNFFKHESIGAEMMEDILKRLRFSNRELELGRNLVRQHMYAISEDHSYSAIRRWMGRVGPENVRASLRMRMADRAGNRKKTGLETKLRSFIRKIREIEKAKNALKVSNLEIAGSDLIELGFTPGPIFSTILNGLLDKVLNDPELNERSRLIHIIEKEWGHVRDSGKDVKQNEDRDQAG